MAFAENEEGEENEVFEVEEISGQEEYRNWVPKKRGFLPIPPKSDFLCSPVKVSAHRKVKLKSKPISQRFEEFVNIFQRSSQRIAKTLEEQTLLPWILTLGNTYQSVKSLTC